jgi:hypothetical protein
MLVMPLFSDKVISKLPMIERAKLKRLPDYLTIDEIVKIKYPDPETQAEKEDYVKRVALESNRHALTTTLLDALGAGDLEYEGDFGRMVDEIAPYIVTPRPPRVIHTYQKLIPSTIKIHKNKFKQFLEYKEEWPVIGLLANWWTDGEMEAVILVDAGAGNQGKKELVIVKDKSTVKTEGRNQKRLEILKEWYAALCSKHNNNRELIIEEIDCLTIEEIKKELTNITPPYERYIWASGADRWIMDNGKTVWKFERTQGGKSKKSK